MTLSTARSAARRAAVLSNYTASRAASSKAPASTNAPSSQPPRFHLPAEKLRQLVSLYHQSREFVTRENLDKKIDEAFVELPSTKRQSPINPYKSYPDLMNAITRRRQEPAVRPLLPVTNAQNARQDIKRSEAVFEALYGSSHGRKPGLELVLETWGSTSKRLEELKEEREASTPVPAPVPRGRSKPSPRRS